LPHAPFPFLGIAVSRSPTRGIASIQRNKGLFFVSFLIGSNLGALADVRALTDNRAWSQEDFAYRATIDRSYIGGVERTISVADAHRGDAKPFVVCADEKLIRFCRTRIGDPGRHL